jgi:hypothetical protein
LPPSNDASGRIVFATDGRTRPDIAERRHSFGESNGSSAKTGVTSYRARAGVLRAIQPEKTQSAILVRLVGIGAARRFESAVSASRHDAD